jgi:hypothetical protein
MLWKFTLCRLLFVAMPYKLCNFCTFWRTPVDSSGRTENRGRANGVSRIQDEKSLILAASQVISPQ